MVLYRHTMVLYLLIFTTRFVATGSFFQGTALNTTCKEYFILEHGWINTWPTSGVRRFGSIVNVLL